jgi:hypothetical protein
MRTTTNEILPRLRTGGLAAVLAAAAGLAGCGGDATPVAETDDPAVEAALTEVVSAESDGTIFLGTTTGVAAISAEAGEPRYAIAPAVAAPDWSTLVTSAPVEGVDGAWVGNTRVAALDPTDGAERWVHEIQGSFEVRQVSTGGEAVVLLPPPDPGALTGTLPVESRERTTMVVLRADGSEQRYDLEGNLEPEAFGARADGIFVIQYSPAIFPEAYRVRWLDLATGEVGDVVDKHGVLQQDMPGLARTQVRSPDGGRLYTYYAVDAPVSGPEPSYAFVHVLDLEEGWAHCLDLPQPFGSGSSAAVALAVSPDGHELVVADAEVGAIAVAETEHLTIARTGDLPASLDAPAAAAIGPGGALHLAAGPTLRRIDTRTLETTGTTTIDWGVLGLDVSPDGEELYVGYTGDEGDPFGRIEVRDGRTGDADRSFGLTLPDPLAFVGRESPRLPYGTKECAC